MYERRKRVESNKHWRNISNSWRKVDNLKEKMNKNFKKNEKKLNERSKRLNKKKQWNYRRNWRKVEASVEKKNEKFEGEKKKSWCENDRMKFEKRRKRVEPKETLKEGRSSGWRKRKDLVERINLRIREKNWRKAEFEIQKRKNGIKTANVEV